MQMEKENKLAKELEFNEADNATVEKFINDNLELFSEPERRSFRELVEHLKKVQRPLRGKISGSILHGINVANIAKEVNPQISKKVLLAMLGHDWDRACGELAVKKEDYPKDKYDEYKNDHAQKSAKLFVEELRKFFSDDDLIQQVHDLICIHEKGGTPEADLIDFADAVALLEPGAAYRYRHERNYKDKDKQPLSGDELEKERAAGFLRKVKFMVSTLDSERLELVKKYVEKNLANYTTEVRQFLEEFFK